MHWDTKKFMWLTLFWYSLYCSCLELNLQYLGGLPVLGAKIHTCFMGQMQEQVPLATAVACQSPWWVPLECTCVLWAEDTWKQSGSHQLVATLKLWILKALKGSCLFSVSWIFGVSWILGFSWSFHPFLCSTLMCLLCLLTYIYLTYLINSDYISQGACLLIIYTCVISWVSRLL